MGDSLQFGLHSAGERGLYQHMVSVAARGGSVQDLWRAQVRLADALVRSGENDLGLAEGLRALKLAGKDPYRQGWALAVIAHAKLRLGDLEGTAGEAERALQLSRRVDDVNLEAATLGILGTVHWRGGRCPASLAAREQVAQLRQKSRAGLQSKGGRWRARLVLQQLGQALEEAGESYRCVGRIFAAASAYEEALEIFNQAGDSWGAARAFLQLAKIRPASGDLERTVQMLKRAGHFVEVLGSDTDDAVMFYNYRAELYTRAGNAAPLRAELTGWAQEIIALNWPYETVVSWENVGRAELSTGRAAEASWPLEYAITLADSFGFLRYRATSRTLLSRAESAVSHGERALSLADTAAMLAESIGDLEIVLDALEARGIAMEAMGSEGATDAYLHAIQTLESWRLLHSQEEIRIGLTEARIGLYERLIRLLLEKGKAAEAFDVAERARARILLELMAEARLRESPATAAQGAPAAPARVAEVQTGLTGPDRGIMSYFWGDEAVYGWWLQSDAVRGARLGSARLLASQVGFLRGAIEDPAAGPDWKPAARRAYEQFVSPLRPANMEQILVIPDGPLAYIPIEILIPTGADAPWATSHRFAYGPSASVLLDLARRPAAGRWPRALLAVGDPEPPGEVKKRRTRNLEWSETAEPEDTPADSAENEQPLAPLPYAGQEARAIQRLFRSEGADVLFGSEATFRRWLNLKPSRYRYLHFATHARVNSIRPASTHLIMAGSRLGLDDVRRLDLTAELVTLSACETALGRRVRGEGVVGLPYAFLAAGARGVVVTLWRIDDRATAEFMKRFYRELREGTSPADALLSVRREWLLTEGPLSHPSRWAPFILLGGIRI
jgi:CHAT domain-containing protein